MYSDPTPWQFARVAGAWMTTAGAALVVVHGRGFDDPSRAWLAWGSVALFVVAVAALVAGWLGKPRVDARNRPFLMSPRGDEALRGRDRTEARLRVAIRWTMAAMVTASGAFLVFAGLSQCGETDGGVCAATAPPYDVIAGTGTVALVALGFYATFMSLRRNHVEETERISEVILRGERERRAQDPFSGQRSRWE